MFPHHKLVPSTNGRDTVEFESVGMGPEELLSIAFREARRTAEVASEETTRSAVITVPPFFSQVQREAVLLAAELAEINVLQLLNANTASALHYAVFRQKSFNKTASHVVFFDMGASNTVATLAAFSVEERKTTSTLRPKESVRKIKEKKCKKDTGTNLFPSSFFIFGDTGSQGGNFVGGVRFGDWRT